MPTLRLKPLFAATLALSLLIIIVMSLSTDAALPSIVAVAIALPIALLVPGWPWAKAFTRKAETPASEFLLLAGLTSIVTVVLSAYLLREFLFEEINNSLIILATLIPTLLGWVIHWTLKRISHERK
jgi:multisubunit Na+/H+ antiporter MnhB subunit